MLLEFLRVRSKLFHSIIADRKKDFWKSYSLLLFHTVLVPYDKLLVAYGVLLTGMRQ